jgi:putative alpha-1,2-mannosidase
VIHLPNGDVTITGNGAAKDVPYVQDLSVNGQAWNKPWLRFSDISHGGSLVFNLSTNANPKWGSDLSVAPPSYDGGN